MIAVGYSQARNNLRTLINGVCQNYDEVVITTKDNQSAVLLSKDEYDSMKETLYLLSSKNNRERLLEAIEEIENSEFLKKDIEI
jgi:antitoxin YefM